MFICEEYRENLNTFQVADGIKAILLSAVRYENKQKALNHRVLRTAGKQVTTK